jgi:hypothetical protein
VVKKLEQSVQRYFTLQAQISGGITFYTNLQVLYSAYRTVLYLKVSCDANRRS